MKDELRIGLLGLGTVGRGTFELLRDHAAMLAERAGIPLRLTHVATCLPLPAKDLELDFTGIELSDDANQVVNAKDVDVVVELIGGIEPARSFVEQALRNGKDVVTANKAMIAEQGDGLIRLAESQGVELAFEAAVAGAVPVVKAFKESLAANRIGTIHGILNGTCNYILTEMRAYGLPFAQVLAEAQRQGYAEADPSLDIDGIDAAHKLAILAAIGFGMPLSYERILVEGIRHIAGADILWATKLGYRIKLLTTAKWNEQGIDLRVQPAMVPQQSMIGAVEGVFNAVFVQGDQAGTLMFYGRGAGAKPTASAVVGDLVDIARNHRAGIRCRVPALAVASAWLRTPPQQPDGELLGEYYLRLTVLDRPGVLADITGVFKRFQVSIAAFHQEANSNAEHIPLVMVTHQTTEQQILTSLGEIRQLDFVREPPVLIRIENI